ncbi:MAG: hypothetical protein ABEK42_13735, partial [Thiohalorhabdaceae bacterium]
ITLVSPPPIPATPEMLAAKLRLHGGAKAIYNRLHRNPESLPPRTIIPGSRLLRWRPEDVDRWLAANVADTTNGKKRRGPGRPRKTGRRTQ